MPVATEQFSWSEKLVLIVEDDHSSQLLLKAILSRTGANIILVEDGESAVEIAKKNQSIDLILMDIKLKGLNGIDASRQIRTIMPNIPIIAQTACAIAGDMERCLEAGCNAYLTKPISSRTLLETIDYYFRRSLSQQHLELAFNAN